VWIEVRRCEKKKKKQRLKARENGEKVNTAYSKHRLHHIGQVAKDEKPACRNDMPTHHIGWRRLTNREMPAKKNKIKKINGGSRAIHQLPWLNTQNMFSRAILGQLFLLFCFSEPVHYGIETATFGSYPDQPFRIAP